MLKAVLYLTGSQCKYVRMVLAAASWKGLQGSVGKTKQGAVAKVHTAEKKAWTSFSKSSIDMNILKCAIYRSDAS